MYIVPLHAVQYFTNKVFIQRLVKSDWRIISTGSRDITETQY